MQLIADSGSTKTDWAILNNHIIEKQFQTAGINPYFMTGKDIYDELHSVFINNFDPQSIKKVIFYGAGCSSQKKAAKIKNSIKQILPFSKISVNHDILGAARALLGNKPGIACILGTGSNSCLYDGKNIIENLFSLGYMFGDEGSGAHLGKTFIKEHLKKQTPDELSEAFTNKYNLSDEEILTNIYQKPNPNKFLASFTHFLKEKIQHSYIKNMIEYCFDEFINEQVSKYSNYKLYTTCCVGSIAYHFKDILVLSLKKHNITPGKIINSPMEDLIKYHSKEHNI